MRKLFLAASLLLALPLVALAQDAPKAEIFGGYSYLNPNNGDDLHGWNASFTGNVNKWFGIKSDFSGYYESYTTVGGAKVRVSDHFFVAGGQFTYRGNERVQPFAHLMAGTVLLRSRTTRNCALTSVNCLSQVKISDTGFALVAGGGVDLKIAKHLALRLIQADYIYVRNNGFNDHGFRLSTGLVGRVGEQ